MATTEELIQQLEEITANGLESVSIGDRNLRYRSIEDLQTILNQLKRKDSGSSSTIQVAYAKTGNGL